MRRRRATAVRYRSSPKGLSAGLHLAFRYRRGSFLSSESERGEVLADFQRRFRDAQRFSKAWDYPVLSNSFSPTPAIPTVVPDAASGRANDP